MSRYDLRATPVGEVSIGWDPPLGTFYLQAQFTDETGHRYNDGPKIWFGARADEIVRVSVLNAVTKRMLGLALSLPLKAQLLQDQVDTPAWYETRATVGAATLTTFLVDARPDEACLVLDIPPEERSPIWVWDTEELGAMPTAEEAPWLWNPSGPSSLETDLCSEPTTFWPPQPQEHAVTIGWTRRTGRTGARGGDKTRTRKGDNA